ncbi:hypothetical protein EYR36_002016 [Pleurotus pulmonarius]|nr:hypothetical protein EYR36_002016 [Pleurotus pulmonarius]KAF4588235.1 hypothetical protein EYR38_010202 [Pleurotus pulmonarius]
MHKRTANEKSKDHGKYLHFGYADERDECLVSDCSPSALDFGEMFARPMRITANASASSDPIRYHVGANSVHSRITNAPSRTGRLVVFVFVFGVVNVILRGAVPSWNRAEFAAPGGTKNRLKNVPSLSLTVPYVAAHSTAIRSGNAGMEGGEGISLPLSRAHA